MYTQSLTLLKWHSLIKFLTILKRRGFPATETLSLRPPTKKPEGTCEHVLHVYIRVCTYVTMLPLCHTWWLTGSHACSMWTLGRWWWWGGGYVTWLQRNKRRSLKGAVPSRAAACWSSAGTQREASCSWHLLKSFNYVSQIYLHSCTHSRSGNRQPSSAGSCQPGSTQRGPSAARNCGYVTVVGNFFKEGGGVDW